MAFPQTRHTLIERLAGGGDEADWGEFLHDYWGPVCRFARQRGNLQREDAEDVASEALHAIVKNNLLARWSANQSAKLRTLICAVVRNVLSNRARVELGRDRIVREHGGMLDRYLDVDCFNPEDGSAESADAFYSAWADDILCQAIEGLLIEYNKAGKGDVFRVLYGRLCEGMSMQEIADALRMTRAAAESHFRRAKQRLSERLQELVRWQVARYSTAEHSDGEFVEEWGRLGEYLREHGGIESAIRSSYAPPPPQS